MERIGLDPFRRTRTFSGLEGANSVELITVDGHGSLLLGRSRVYRDETVPVSVLSIQEQDGTVSRIPSPARERRQQTLGGALNDDWAVWMETTSAGIDTTPWVLYAFDRTERRTREIAKSPKIDGRDPVPPPGYTGPALSGGWVSWAQIGGHRGAERVDIYSCRVASCTPRRVARRSAFPSAHGNRLFYIDYPSRLVNGEPTRPSSMRIKAYDFGSGRASTIATVPLQAGQSPGGLAVGGRQALWIVRGPTDFAHVYDLATHDVTLVRAEDEGGFGYPVAGDDFVAWGESMGNSPDEVGGYVVLADGRLRSVGNHSGLYGFEASGRYLAWQDVLPQGAPYTPERVHWRVGELRGR